MRTYPWWDEWIRVCDKYFASGYQTLTEEERTWLTVRELIDAVNNGGLISYFFNPGADHYDDCLASLRRLQANEIAVEVWRLGSMFGESVPVSIERRNEIINSWPRNGHERTVSNAVDEVILLQMNSLEQTLERFLFENGYCK